MMCDTYYYSLCCFVDGNLSPEEICSVTVVSAPVIWSATAAWINCFVRTWNIMLTKVMTKKLAIEAPINVVCILNRQSENSISNKFRCPTNSSADLALALFNDPIISIDKQSCSAHWLSKLVDLTFLCNSLPTVTGMFQCHKEIKASGAELLCFL